MVRTLDGAAGAARRLHLFQLPRAALLRRRRRPLEMRERMHDVCISPYAVGARVGIVVGGFVIVSCVAREAVLFGEELEGPGAGQEAAAILLSDQTELDTSSHRRLCAQHRGEYQGHLQSRFHMQEI
jgi:hypothetical protein